MSVKTIEALLRQINAKPPPSPMKLTGTLPGGFVGVAYSATLTLAGTFVAPVTITASVGSIPSWMSVAVSGTSVKFTGTPTSAATTGFTLKAADSSSTPQISTSGQSVTISSSSPNAMKLAGVLPIAYAGDAYAGTVGISGTYVMPVTVGTSAGSLPSWMTATVLSAENGQTHIIKFTGTPPAGVASPPVPFTILAQDSTSPTPQQASLGQNIKTVVPGPFVPSGDVQQAGLTVFVRDTSVPVAPDSPSIIINSQIDWGDGSPVQTMAQPSFTSANRRYAQHTYTSAGSYTMIQTVTDAQGAQGVTHWPLTLVAFVPPTITGAAGTATVTGVLGNGTQINTVASLGHRVKMVPGNINGGSMKFYSDGLCVSVANDYMGIVDDLFGEFHVYAGSTLLFSGPLPLWVGAGARPFWVNTPVPLSSPDLSLFPHYGSGGGSASWYSQYMAGDNSPMGRGNVLSAMGSGGEHDYLGPLPSWDADYLNNPTAQNAFVVRGMGDSAAVWSFHFIDPATDLPVVLRDNVKISNYSSSLGQAGNPIVKYRTYAPQSLDQTQDHAINFSSLCCALYGTDFDREQLTMWCNYVQAICWPGNSTYRLPQGCVSAATIPRGIGRGLVVMSYASKLSSQASNFAYWMGAYGANLIARYGSQTGIQTIHNGWGYPPLVNGVSQAQGPWQMALACYGIGLAIKHGYTAAIVPGFQWAFDYFMATFYDSLVSTRPGNGGIQHEFATNYTYSWAYPNGNIVPNWGEGIRTIAGIQATLAAALQQPENSAALQAALGSGGKPGDLEGYPTSPSGYAAMMQIALALGVDVGSDTVGANAAWNAFAHNSVGWGLARIIYSSDPKYNIVPV